MATLSYVDVGVDISKKHLDICLHQSGKTLRVANSQHGLGKLLRLLSQYEVGQIVCEATGGYERLMRKTLSAANHKVWVVQPKRIKGFIVSEGIKAKTDKIDAKMIAAFASQKCSAYEAIQQSDNGEKLKSLVALKASKTAMAAEIKTQLQQAYDADCLTSLTKHLKFLEKQIERIEGQISALIEDDKDLQNKAKLITSIPGIGDGTCAMTLAMLPELGKIDNKQVAALVGVAPYIKQSGDYKGQARINGGRSPLRSILYMAALSAIKHNAVLSRFYQRLIDAGKAFKVAIVAVMRKLIVYMNTLVSRKELWNPAI
jgi:transposase